MKVNDQESREREETLNERIVKRVEELEALLLKEPWLPCSLRGLLATELPQIVKTARMGGSIWRKRVSKQLLVASLASWDYGPSALESKTISGIQALELEVNGSVSHERKHGAFDRDGVAKETATS